MNKFKNGDRVVVTNIDGMTENVDLGWTKVQGIGDYGTVQHYDGNSWPVFVQMDVGGSYYYSESELELVVDK